LGQNTNPMETKRKAVRVPCMPKNGKQKRGIATSISVSENPKRSTTLPNHERERMIFPAPEKKKEGQNINRKI